ncbi:unnamed protein product [Trichobilharzia szidati]|nr:unnamed protein product [Trichobilharzia szidati]
MPQCIIVQQQPRYPGWNHPPTSRSGSPYYGRGPSPSPHRTCPCCCCCTWVIRRPYLRREGRCICKYW